MPAFELTIMLMLIGLFLFGRIKNNDIKKFYPKIVAAVLTLNTLLIPTISFGSVNRLLHFEWSYNTSLPHLAGYIIYQNGTPIADINDPTALEMDLDVILESDINSFTMTAFDKAGNESAHSAAYTLEIPPEDAYGNMLPLGKIKTSGTTGEASFFVEFDATGSMDYDGIITEYEWDFDDDYGATGDMVSHAFQAAGIYTVTLTVSDNEGATSTAHTTITVTEPTEIPNEPPNAVITASAASGTAPLLIRFDGTNSYDPDGIIAKYRWNFGGGSGAQGDLTVHTFDTAGVYPVALIVTDDQGATSLAESIITVTKAKAVNKPPAANKDIASTNKNTAVVIPVLGNDSDPNGDKLTVSKVKQAAFGKISTNGSSITYIPKTGWSGTDVFTYTVSDGRGGKSSASVTVKVLKTLKKVNSPPTAVNSYLRTLEDTAATGKMIGRDKDGGKLSYSIVRQASLGKVTLTNQTSGFFRYKPKANVFGIDSFTFRVSDGQARSKLATVKVRIDPVNDLPVALPDWVTTKEDRPVRINVRANDRDADKDPLSIIQVANGSHGTTKIMSNKILYTPEKDFSGKDKFTYKVSDGHGGKASGTVSITIVPVNDAPRALDGNVFTASGSLLKGKLSASDPEAKPLTYTIVSKPAKGVLVLNDSKTGRYTYHSKAGARGVDSFTFRVSDGRLSSKPAKVIINFSQPVK